MSIARSGSRRLIERGRSWGTRIGSSTSNCAFDIDAAAAAAGRTLNSAFWVAATASRW